MPFKHHKNVRYQLEFTNTNVSSFEGLVINFDELELER